jgi:hypothetical protein
MDKPIIEALAERLERLERENRRWRWAAGVAALAWALLVVIGGLVGPRVILAQPAGRPEIARPTRPRMEYTRSDEFLLADMEGVLNRMAADGWEVVQVVPTQWGMVGEASGYFTKFIAQAGSSYARYVAVARRPALGPPRAVQPVIP